MEEIDELIPHPDKTGRLSLTHRAWAQLDSVVWTFGKELIELDVSFNNLEFLPPELGDLLLLRSLNLSCNKLDALPVEIGKCTRLKVLKVNGNYLEALPSEIGKCILLEELIVSENKIAELPVSLAGLQGLHILNAANNCLTSIPYQLGAVESLEMIDLAGNKDLDMVPAGMRSDTAMMMWLFNLHKAHAEDMQGLEKLNARLEARTQQIEESKLRMEEDIRKLEEKKRLLLKERPAAYLALKAFLFRK
ncbi:unnamed protein product [Chrysoparadoxa australica]